MEGNDAEVRMAASSDPIAENPALAGRRTRRITPEAGRALEILGHAIEYLADEYAIEKRIPKANDPRLEAIQILMKLNRQVYFECPAVTTSAERIRAFLRSLIR